MKKSQGCFECSHPSCAYSFIANGISQCFECTSGVLLLDSTTPPKYRIICNKCTVCLILPDTIYKMEVTEDACAECETPLVEINYHKDKTPLENNETTISSCVFCDKMFKQLIENYMNAANKKLNNNFRGRPSFRGKHAGPRRKKRFGGAANGGAKNLNW